MANLATAKPFPGCLTPTSRRYTPGTIPRTDFRAQNGATSFVYYGRQHVDAKLELTFQNISDARAADILWHYQQMTEDDFVTFLGSQNNVYAGMEGDLRKLVEDGQMTLRWRYQDPPQITSVVAGVSTVQCRFIGYLYGT